MVLKLTPSYTIVPAGGRKTSRTAESPSVPALGKEWLAIMNDSPSAADLGSFIAHKFNRVER